MTTIATKYPFVGNVDTRTGGREENQDNAGFVDTPIGFLLVVCDGMGGGPGGKTASRLAVKSILNVLAEVSPSTPRDKALSYAITKANDLLYSKAKETPELRGMGSTVAAMIVNEESAVIAHVGDTRIYLLRKGTIIYRSNDHSMVADLVREHKLTEEEARNHPRSNVITRVLGVRPEVEAEIDEIPFQRGDRFVLCTDGIWGALPQANLVKSLSRVMGIGELTSLVTEEIDAAGNAAGGGHDNMTLAILDSTFDSHSKKVKKATSETQDKEQSKSHQRGVGKVGKYLLLILLAAVVATLVFFFLNRGESHKENHNSDEASKVENQKGGTGSTMSRNDVVKYQIKALVSKLDSLKEFKKSDREQLKNFKKRYVEQEIRPNMKILRDNLDAGKWQELDDIEKMLDDSKTSGASKVGETTGESNKHIDSIKDRLNKLQE